jgi:hypothetical protein
MISLLKTKGYKLTKNDTVNNREFRESIKSYSINEERSSFGEQVYDLLEQFELFLDERLYTDKKMKAILDATRDESIDEVTVDVEQQERGYLITFTTIKQGVT